MATEEALDMYSPLELEYWVLQRRSADWEWQCKSHPVHERVIALDADFTLSLVPGGRWLLTTMDNGSVLCHDLENSQMQNNILVPPRDDPNDRFLYGVTVELDIMCPTSKFFMVTYPSEYYDPSVTGSLDLMIWSVNLRGHGSSAFLEAHFLHSFPATEPLTSVTSISISGNLLARLMHTSRSRSYIEIFDRTSCTMSVHRRTVIFPKDLDSKHSVSVSLLPGGRLAFVSHHNVFIYDIGTMTEDKPIRPIIPQTPSEPQWTSFDSHGDYQFSHRQSSQDNEAVILVLISRHVVYHLVIPHNVEQPPHVARYVNVPQEYHIYTAGTHKVLGEKQGSILVKVGTTNHLRPDVVTAHQLNVSPHLQWFLRHVSFNPPLLIEDIGRIIFKDKREIFILETSRFPKSL